MNVAIAHDYLTQRGGAERVVLALCRAFPDAPIHTSLYDPGGTFPEFRERRIRPLWLNRVPSLRKRHRLALPVLPLAWAMEHVDTDVVICSSSGWAHGIRTSGRKVVYCHSPAKWLYRADDYLGARPGAGARVAAGALTPMLRRFDHWAARSAETYLANSRFIAAQVLDVYGIDATVIPPPAGLASDGLIAPMDIEPGFLLTVARLLPYKNVRQTAEAVRDTNQKLVIVGEGPQGAELRGMAAANVHYVGEVDDASLRWLYGNCGGLVAASREDFGLTPIEAASFGKPVAALRFGGFLDTVDEDVNGVFFDSPTEEAIRDAIAQITTRAWDADLIRSHAAAFGEDRFVRSIRSIVEAAR